MAGTYLQKRSRQERLLYLTAAVILIAGVVTAAIIVATGGPPAASSHAIAPTSVARGTGFGDTCAGWSSVKSQMEAMTKMPDGWTYDTPQIDITIAARAAQLKTLVNLFVKDIMADPPEAAAAAHAWVDAQSTEGPKLINHTFGPDDQTKIDAAAHGLDVACGMG
ncbi:hypothetical protein BH09ACT8_BH09ACT8_66550 [soil metagenome]